MRNALYVLLVAMLLAGCAQEGYVRAESIKELLDKVCERHDDYVQKDAAYLVTKDGKSKQASHLRSSKLLRRVVDDAIRSKKNVDMAVDGEKD